MSDFASRTENGSFFNRRATGRRPAPGILPAGVALACGLALACGSSDQQAGGPGRQGGPGGGPGGRPGGFGGGSAPVTAVPVEVVEILPGAISAFIETNGTLEAEREVDIVARTGGPLVALNTEEGVRVRAGDVLAQIDEAESRAQLEIARVALQDAELVFNRAKASLENAIVSQEVYDTALSALESARAQVSGSEIQLGYTRITAPFDGLIIQRSVKFGETVTAGQQLFRISDFDPLWCTIGVPERDLTRLSIGQPAIIEVEAFPERTFRGRVLRISPVVDSATGTIRVTLEVDREGRLSPGMFAGVRLVTDIRQDALIMPKRALSLESLADSVFVVEDGVAYRRNITLGYEEDDQVEVTSGLAHGDRVIVVGQDGLTDATPVQILAGPGADETPVRTAGGAAPGGGFEMTDERRAAMRERMRERGMTDAQIEERLAAMASRGGPPGGGPPAGGPRGGGSGPGGPPARGAQRPAASGAPTAGPAAAVAPGGGRLSGPGSERDAANAPASETTPPTSATDEAEGAPADPAASPPARPAAPRPPDRAERAGRPRPDRSGGPSPRGAGPGSFESLPPETQEAIRGRLRTMGLTDVQIEERIRHGWGPGQGPEGQSSGAETEPPNAPPTPEQLDQLRERLRERGMTEEQIEEIVARRRRPPE